MTELAQPVFFLPGLHKTSNTNGSKKFFGATNSAQREYTCRFCHISFLV